MRETENIANPTKITNLNNEKCKNLKQLANQEYCNHNIQIKKVVKETSISM